MTDEAKPRFIHEVTVRNTAGAVVDQYETPPMVATEAEMLRWLKAERPKLVITVTSRPARFKGATS